MALPDYLVGLANNFVTQYGNLIFDPSTGGMPKGLPANVQQQTAPFTQQQWEGLYGIQKGVPQAQNVADTAANQATATMGGQYLNPGSTGNQWLSQGLQNMGVSQTAATMGGAYLDPSTNPYLAGTFQSAASPMIQAYQTATAPSNMAAAQRAGQFGSTAMGEQGQLNQYSMGQNLQNLAANIYGGAYQQERGIQSNTTNQVQQSQNAAFQNERARQLQALSMAPGTAQGLFNPSQALYGSGAQVQQQNQTQMDTNYANAVANYEAPFNQLQGYGNALLTAGGGGATQTTATKSGSLACNFFFSRGLTDRETRDAAEEYGRMVSRDVLLGYRAWIRPLVRAMEKSETLTRILTPVGRAWSKEMKARARGGEGSLLGKFILFFGEPLSSVVGLFLRRRPATVRFFIVPVSIRMAVESFTSRSFSHVFNKVSKIFFPSFAISDPASAVVPKVFMLGIVTTLFHALPRTISPRSCVPMNDVDGSKPYPLSAPAALGVSLPERFAADDRCIPAFAPAEPHCFSVLGNSGTLKDGELSKNLSGEILDGVHVDTPAGGSIAAQKIFPESNSQVTAVAPAEPSSFFISSLASTSKMLKNKEAAKMPSSKIGKLWYDCRSHFDLLLRSLVRVAGDLRNRLRPVIYTPLPPERQQFRKSILALQNAMVAAAANGTLKAEDYPLRHYFTPFDKKYECFCYAREIFIPKGQIVIGKIHRHSHLNFILKGKVSVATEFGPKYFEAPCIFVSEVGLKRAVVTIEDTIWVTVHLTSRSGEKNLEAIEDELIAKSYEELAQ